MENKTEAVATVESTIQREPEKRFGCLQVFFILLVGIIIAVALTFFVLKKYIFPSEFAPVVLNQKEEQVLEQKLERFENLELNEREIDNIDLEIRQNRHEAKQGDPNDMTPEVYSEKGASREVNFTEKELNSLLASNTDLARKISIDLADDLVSAKVLVPVDEDFPFFAGKTLRVRAGMKLAFENDRPIVILRGISIMGVPIPNAWLGGLKNIDLVNEFGNDRGFWKSFAAGVEYLEIQEGRLKLKLKE
ncbi:MAG: arginine N-succinyltransferase [Gammaproteobacteria bacterium]